MASCLDMLAIVVSTGDGVPLCRAVRPGAAVEPEALAGIERRLSHYCAAAAEQAQKMGLGPLKVTTTLYDKLCLVHVYMLPLVITCVHSPDSNCGTTLDIVPELREALDPIRAQVQAVYDREFAGQ
ncbi:hypothetical protein JKP88DRAFT_222703 [Tribonema minus]|uniref:Uncharacterized protein n=1 Tax=Tribonema minus TaxID=303371 RepID=A0A836CDC5_9STRA|nr:hypothetical protein JKP88DRAFT_222703 [Tribonema minus]